jgi:peptidoglycan/xylan/chitin deacetylase (PgdA/CDA1 family)
MKKNRIVKIVLSVLLLIVGTMLVADAHIPVTYSCCQNYSYSDGIQLDNFEYVPPGGVQIDGFENIGNWTLGGTGAGQTVDTINFEEGSQGLKLIATNGNKAYTDKVINNNFSATNNFSIWIYVPNTNTFHSAVIYITSNGTSWGKSAFKQDITGTFQQGWNRLVLDKNNFIQDSGTVGSESWNNVMNRLRLTIYPNSGQNTNVTFDDLRYDVNTGWTGIYQEADTVNFKEGSQGLKLISANGNLPYADKTINMNFSATNNFAIWVYVDNASNLNLVDMYITSTGNFSKYFVDSEYRGVKTGWNRLVFNKNHFTNNFGENWNNVMNRIRLRIFPITGSNVNVTFDDLRYDMTGQRAKLMIEFDDGQLSTYTDAYPILNANNQRGVSYVVTSYAGNDPNYMNLTNLKVLQSAGWDISSHTVNHVDLTAISDTSLVSELNDSYDWLVANGFQKSAGFIAYPFGYVNDITINQVKKRYIFGRATKPEPAQQHFTQTDDGIQYIQRIIGVYNDSTVQDITDQINDTINSRLLGILMFHNIADTNPGPNPDTYTYLTSDLQKISNYIKSRNADIDVVTYDDYVAPNINSFTPVINKTSRIYPNGTVNLIIKNEYDEYMPNMTIKPLSYPVDINITTYNETGGLVKFNESGSNSDLQVAYSIGDRTPNQAYNVKIYWTNGTKYQDFNVGSDSTGYIKYNSAGFGTPRYQIIDKTSALTIITSSPIDDPVTRSGDSQIFNITLNKAATITWYINGSIIQTNSSISAMYTNNTVGIGVYNVTVNARNGTEYASRMWNWSVIPRSAFNIIYNVT